MRGASIRPAGESDLQAFLAFGEAMGNTPGVWKNDPQSDFHDLLSKMKEGKKIFLLCVKEDAVTGFAIMHMFRRLDPSRQDPKSCTVGVAVHPDFRRQGIGTRLAQQGLKRARARGIRMAYTFAKVENIGMQKLAEKLGFARYAISEKDGWRFSRYKRRI